MPSGLHLLLHLMDISCVSVGEHWGEAPPCGMAILAMFMGWKPVPGKGVTLPRHFVMRVQIHYPGGATDPMRSANNLGKGIETKGQKTSLTQRKPAPTLQFGSSL